MPVATIFHPSDTSPLDSRFDLSMNTHTHTHIHCVSISIVHSTFLYTYISPPFHDLAALGCYIFNTTLAIRSGGNPRFLVRPTGLHDQPWHDGGRDERQEEGGERERERSGKKDRKKRNTLFEWIASLHSYAWKDNLEAEKNRVSFSVGE